MDRPEIPPMIWECVLDFCLNLPALLRPNQVRLQRFEELFRDGLVSPMADLNGEPARAKVDRVYKRSDGPI